MGFLGNQATQHRQKKKLLLKYQTPPKLPATKTPYDVTILSLHLELQHWGWVHSCLPELQGVWNSFYPWEGTSAQLSLMCQNSNDSFIP